MIRPLLIGLIAALAMCFTCYGQDNGTLGLKYEYQNAGSVSGKRTSFNGWDIVPTYKLSKRIGVFGSFSGGYGGVYQNVHAYTFGPSYSFPNSSRITPVIYTEAGVSRTSKPGAIADSFDYALGALLSIKLNSHVNLIIEPAEYAVTTPMGGPVSTFVSEYGLSFPINKPKKKKKK